LLTHGKLKALAPADSELWLDGGHNAEGGRAVAAALGELEERVPRPLVLIVGMLATKDTAGFLQNFAGLARRVIAVPIPDQEKTTPPGTLVDVARAVGLPAEGRNTIEDALAAVHRLELTPAPRILIAGSLYLAGAVLARNGTPPE
jgi:dihydrofolate synthase/folylpolyglutamate synthase